MREVLNMGCNLPEFQYIFSSGQTTAKAKLVAGNRLEEEKGRD